MRGRLCRSARAKAGVVHCPDICGNGVRGAHLQAPLAVMPGVRSPRPTQERGDRTRSLLIPGCWVATGLWGGPRDLPHPAAGTGTTGPQRLWGSLHSAAQTVCGTAGVGGVVAASVRDG